MTETPRPGDQPLPTPNDGVGMHDLVIADLRPETSTADRRLVEELVKRRDVGLERYGSLLQVGNGRDARRDLLEECLDGIVYARQASLELPEGTHRYLLQLAERSLKGAAALTLGVIDELAERAGASA